MWEINMDIQKYKQWINERVIKEAMKTLDDIKSGKIEFSATAGAKNINIHYNKATGINGYLGCTKVSNDTYKVTGVNAEKGYGPLLYHILLEYLSSNGYWLTPDYDGEVSQDAKKIWKKMLNYTGIKVKPLSKKYFTDKKELYLNNKFKKENIEFLEDPKVETIEKLKETKTTKQDKENLNHLLFREWLEEDIIGEASVASLSQRHKIPVEFAQYVNDKYRQNADAILSIYVNRYSKFNDLEGHIDNVIKNFERFMEFKGQAVNDLLKRFPKKKDEVVALAKKDWREFIKYMRSVQDETEKQNNAIIKFPDGFYWLDLKVNSCSKEAGAMQHCGYDPNGILYSLRDSNDKSHVTISKDENNVVFQIKGKQNQFPDKKYWNYIYKFLKYFNVEKIIEPGMDPDFEIEFLNSVESSLTEAKLSKVWRRKAKERARRNERPYPNQEDRKWALKQQEKWNKKYPELEQKYLKEIEHAQSLSNATKEYLMKIRQLRKQQIEAKKNKVGTVKFGPGTPEKAADSISVPLEPVHGKGVAGGYKEKINKLKKKSSGSATIAPGESFGTIGENVDENS
jgi:hypothetical protein